MPPSAKRRKRNIVQSSDNEDDPPKSRVNTLNNYLFSSPEGKNTLTSTTLSRASPVSPSPARKSSRLLAASQPVKPIRLNAPSTNGNGTGAGRRSSHKIASASPEKNKAGSAPKRTVKQEEEKGRSADLKTLFSKQAERVPMRSPTKLEDIISDPISDEDEVGDHRAASSSRVGQNARRRLRDPPPSAKSTAAVSSSNASRPAAPAITSSQKFLKPPAPPRDPSQDDEQRPWSERFGPQNLGELAVHKKKVADVRRWAEDVMAGRMRQRLLILKGAAGTGKTTTMRLLAKDMRCELLEWKNPTGALGFLSASAQFDEFMGRGGKFGQLDIDLGEAATLLRARNGTDGTDDNARRIILIEEFPNTFTGSSTALMSFRSTILQYLAENTPSLATFGSQNTPKHPITPIVMVISETLLTTTSASADSFTAHRLLGPEIIRHPGTCMIEFNAVAPTLLAGALELIVQKEARKSGRRRTPGPLVLRRLGEIGDIRSAISSLEFLCLKGDVDADWGSKVSFTKPKRGTKNAPSLTKGETESLELVSQREASLGIFHAVGKVVYNKRDELPKGGDSEEGVAEILPDFLAMHSRLNRSEVSVDSLIDETGTDTHTFISALHENYVLSCESTGPADPNSAVDYLNTCIEYLSESDLLCPSWDVFFGGRASSSGTSGFGGRDSASHVLRQDEMAFQVATRGLLFSLPNPVKRSTAKSGWSGSDAFKMFYPTSLKLWREKEELEGLVDHWASTLLKGDETGQRSLTSGASAFKKPKPISENRENGGDWIGKQSSFSSQRKSSEQGEKKSDHGLDNEAAPLLSLGSSARRELLLERLPYMAHIAPRRKTSVVGSAVRLRDLERVVTFSGIGVAAAGLTDEESAADDTSLPVGVARGEEAWATDKQTEEGAGSPRKTRRGPLVGIRNSNSATSFSSSVVGDLAQPVQKLYLSDDDIEDFDD